MRFVVMRAILSPSKLRTDEPTHTPPRETCKIGPGASPWTSWLAGMRTRIAPESSTMVLPSWTSLTCGGMVTGAFAADKTNS